MIYNLGLLVLPVIIFKVRCFGLIFLAFECGICEYGDVMWEQIARTSRDDLLRAEYIEEKLDMKKKYECKSTLYNSNLPSCSC